MISKKESWQDNRINEINLKSKIKGYPSSPSNPYFDEVYAIYDSKAKTYNEFKKEFKGEINDKFTTRGSREVSISHEKMRRFIS